MKRISIIVKNVVGEGFVSIGGERIDVMSVEIGKIKISKILYNSQKYKI